jgi:hypothetical protein
MASAAFQYDDVSDWLAGFETDGVTTIEAALATVTDLEPDDYVEAADAAFALAAAELVAAARDADPSRVPKSIHAALETHEDAINSAKLASAARKAVQRILRNSELKDAADEEGEGDEWSEDLGELLERLRS